MPLFPAFPRWLKKVILWHVFPRCCILSRSDLIYCDISEYQAFPFITVREIVLLCHFYRIRWKNSPHSFVTEKASAENGIRSALIRNLLENSLLVSSLPNTARLCQLFFCFALCSISNSRKLSCCHSVKEPTRNFLSHLQYNSFAPSLTACLL